MKTHAELVRTFEEKFPDAAPGEKEEIVSLVERIQKSSPKLQAIIREIVLVKKKQFEEGYDQ